MTDRSKNSPINIPINFVDEKTATQAESDDPYDDAIEIDGDAMEFDGTAEVDEMEAPAAESDAEETRLEPADDEPESAAADETVVERDEVSAPTAEARAPRDSGPLGGTSDARATRDSGPLGDSSEAAPATSDPRLSVEAFTQLSQELRQKTELADRVLVEKNALYDQLLRKQAEFENYRKRADREMQETYRRARADILLDILPALDNFDLAMQHADTADPSTLREGIALIHRQLTDILGRHGLEVVEAAGKKFDPELHEAVATETDDSVEDHTVVQELQRGYKLGERLLRPARVKVSVQS